MKNLLYIFNVTSRRSALLLIITVTFSHETPCPAPFMTEKSTRSRSPLHAKYASTNPHRPLVKLLKGYFWAIWAFPSRCKGYPVTSVLFCRESLGLMRSAFWRWLRRTHRRPFGLRCATGGCWLEGYCG